MNKSPEEILRNIEELSSSRFLPRFLPKKWKLILNMSETVKYSHP